VFEYRKLSTRVVKEYLTYQHVAGCSCQLKCWQRRWNINLHRDKPFPVCIYVTLRFPNRFMNLFLIHNVMNLLLCIPCG